MPTQDWPTSRAFAPVQRDGFTLGIQSPKSAFAGFYTGNRQTWGHLADRLLLTLQLPPCTPADGALREAFIGSLVSTGDWVRFSHLLRPEPLGLLGGSPVVQTSAAVGARSLTLQNARAGNNLLRSVDQITTWLGTGWTPNNATVTQNAAAAPDGTTTAWVLTRTATGNHFASALATVAATANRTITSVVWLKAGTLSGNVVLRLRDGAETQFGTATVTPTSTWAPYRVSALFGPAAVANVRLYIDPANDTGSAGETLQVWYSDVRVGTGLDTNCVTWAGSLAAPAGLPDFADEVRRSSSSNAYTAWYLSTTAHAGRTYTFSVWLKSGTYTGGHVLYLRDGANNTVASVTTTTTGSWGRYSVTGTFGASPAADILVYVDPADGGSVGETFGMYGVQLELGGAPTEHSPWPTAAPGDLVGVGGNLLQVGPAGAVGDLAGTITLPLVLPVRAAIAGGAAVTTRAPTGRFELLADRMDFGHGPGRWQRPLTLQFLERVA